MTKSLAGHCLHNVKCDLHFSRDDEGEDRAAERLQLESVAVSSHRLSVQCLLWKVVKAALLQKHWHAGL